MSKIIKFHLLNESVCIRLMLYGQDIQNLLTQNGWQETISVKDADVVLINTCAFLKSAEDKAAKQITDAIGKKRPDQQIVVFGCLPGINPKRLEELKPDMVIGSRDIKEVIEKFSLVQKSRSIGHTVSRHGSRLSRSVRYLNRVLIHGNLHQDDRTISLDQAHHGICVL